MGDSKIKDRIRKLLSLANNNPSAEEAASAMGMAMRMMQKYNIDHANLIEKELKSGKGVVQVVLENGPNFIKEVATWYNILVTGVAKTLDCHCTITRDNGKLVMAIYGYKADAEIADWLVGYLYQQIEVLCDAAWKVQAEFIKQDHGRSPWASERTRMKNEYRYGMVCVVLNKVKEVYSKEQATQNESDKKTSSNLVVFKDQAIKEAFPFLDTNYNETKKKVSHFGIKGMKDANKVNVNKVVSQSETVLSLN